jgi:hypothetical protein
MDYQTEYDDMFATLGDHGAAFFKFFDLFRVCLGDGEGLTKGLHYGKDCSDTKLSDEVLRELKSFLKTQRTWLRKAPEKATPNETRRRMWFWTQKLIEIGAFDRSIRRDIVTWMDICIERSMEDCDFKIIYKANNS